jgi:hypothetical protein
VEELLAIAPPQKLLVPALQLVNDGVMPESSFFLTVKSTPTPKKIAPPYSVELQFVNLQSIIAAPPYIPSAKKERK